MNPTSLQAAIIAAVTQVLALVVSFGVLSDTTQAVVISAVTALINAAFLVAHALHNAHKP